MKLDQIKFVEINGCCLQTMFRWLPVQRLSIFSQHKDDCQPIVSCSTASFQPFILSKHLIILMVSSPRSDISHRKQLSTSFLMQNESIQRSPGKFVAVLCCRFILSSDAYRCNLSAVREMKIKCCDDKILICLPLILLLDWYEKKMKMLTIVESNDLYFDSVKCSRNSFVCVRKNEI